MKNDFFISIIVPVYNVAEYLNQCIESIINQTYTNFELILIDDGSTDNSGQICDDWANKKENIFVTHQSNHGLSYARNVGINNANGDYIVFLDSDDYWLSNNFLKDINTRLKITKPDVLSFNFSKIFNVKKTDIYFKNTPTMPEKLENLDSFKYLINNNLWIACAWNKIIKREFFSDNHLRFVNGITSEDIDWCARLALICSKFDYINILGVGYNQRANSISNSVNSSKLTFLLNNILITETLINDSKDYYKGNLLKSYLAYQIGTLIINFALSDEKRVLKDNVHELKKLCRYLTYSNSKKIKLLNFVIRLLGLNNTISVVRIIKNKGAIK